MHSPETERGSEQDAAIGDDDESFVSISGPFASLGERGTNGQTPRPLILLAEDDLDVQAALTEFLELSGYDVVAVNNGSDMLDALASAAAREDREADLIITDVRMPGFNGLSIAEELRADGWKQPIIIISAFGDDVIKERIRRLEGQTEFFPKPLDPGRLEKTLADLCAR